MATNPFLVQRSATPKKPTTMAELIAQKQAEASLYKSTAAPTASSSVNANEADFFGDGGTAPSVQAPVAAPSTITDAQRAAFAAASAAYQRDPGASVTQTAVNPVSGVPLSPAAQAAIDANRKRPETNSFLDVASELARNPVVNPIGYAATKGGQFIDDKLGTSVSGYIQDPAGQALSDLGAPDAVQAFANPTGYFTRRAVNANTGYGTNVPAAVQSTAGGIRNLNNDIQNAQNAVADVGVPGLGDVFGDPGAGLGQYAQRAQELGAGARGDLAPVTAQRDAQARDMYAQGQSAQGRAAAQTGYVGYGPSQSVAASNAAHVNYGPSQSISAPTLAGAQQAAMGGFGAEQRVNAAQVGGAAQAQAQQAQSQARSIADLDFALSNESRGAMGESINRIRSYVDQGPGESQAQAQLRMAQEQNLGDALSLARSGRGNAAGNMKMALSENAATNAQTNMQAALLRANEADLWRGRQLQGLGLEQQGTTAMRGQDLTAAQAQGQHAVSREQIASNVDVANAQLGTQVSLGNAEQQNLGTRLQAQLSTEAAIQQAALANSRNVAMGQAGTQTNIANAEQSNLTSRLQGQLQSEAAIQQAALANQLAIAQGDSSTQIGVTNANNQSAAGRAQAELANALAIAQGNSSTNINQANLEAQIRQAEANDAMTRDMYGYGLDSQRQGQDALTTGLNLERDYSQQAAELAAEMAKARAIRQAALIGGGASLIEELIPG